jgi:hypothetical protein
MLARLVVTQGIYNLALIRGTPLLPDAATATAQEIE